MTYSQSILFLIAAIVAYVIIIDENVSIYASLSLKIIKNEVARRIWMIQYHPRNPITNLIMRRKYDRIAQELMEEFNSKKDV